MTATAAQASPTQHVAASRPSIGRRSSPTAVLPRVHGPVSQRWRERPRCPALTVAPSPWRRGRSRHRWQCRVSLSVECVSPGRTRQPRARDLSLVPPNNEHSSQRAHLSDMPLTSSGRMRSVRTHGLGTVTIAHVQSRAVLGVVNALRCASTRHEAGPAGIDDACARHSHGFCAMLAIPGRRTVCDRDVCAQG